jgi:molybdopterin/thiamine biosynthesis adenylyltransferase/rhodanese-related sulfurtransferase
MSLRTDQYERYARQVSLPGLGEAGQEKLGQARVLVAGAGGLGSPVIQYLAAAGVGTLGIIDGDRVEISNLHRQLLYDMQDIGQLKAKVAADRVGAINPAISCQAYPWQINNKNALGLIAAYDIIVDCTDNFVARYTLSDACRLLDKPLVFAAVFQFEGQVSVFNQQPNPIVYRDMFPEPPDPATVPDCNDAGVLGVLPGLIGILQATEVIKIITGIGEPLAGKLLNYDIRTHSSIVIELSQQPEPTGPVTREEFESIDYNWFCRTALIPAITKQELAALISRPGTIAIDVRELHELPDADFLHTRIPLSTFNSVPDLSGFDNIIVFCQSGTRSISAGGILKEKLGAGKQVVQLKGGLAAYNRDEHA